jgi:prepilin-type N-terminal cleavage/methylation domain-containing protein
MISPASRQGRASAAFTLIEILLVLAIIGILSAVVVPSVVRSMGSSERRMAVRTVVAAGRYARSMAVLKQVQVVLEFDLAKHAVRVSPWSGGAEGAAALGSAPDLGEFGAVDEPAATNAVVDGADDISLERALEPIKLEAVTVEGLEPEDEGGGSGDRVSVVYDVNGRCTPYRVVLVDRGDSRIIISIDALASSSIVEMGP